VKILLLGATGNVAEASAFTKLVQTVIDVTTASLGEGGRLWVFGGAALLTVPGHSAHGRRPAQSPEGLRGSPHQPGCTSEKSIGLVDAVPWADDRVREWQADT
jgi:hypothetical protein